MVKKTDSEIEYKYDVFISYSSKDKEWVRGELLKRIEQAGLKAFIDYRDFEPGAQSILECERGVLECRKTLVILTPDYVESEWCEFEGVMALTLSPSNRDLRLIPLLKTECRKPLRIGTLTHVDFTDGADLDLAWRQLMTSLGKPPEPPKQQQFDVWCMVHPYPIPPNFTGRFAECQMLTGWLDVDDAHPLLSLRALGGFGKSALVWHWLTHDVKPADWPRVVWWNFYESDATFDRFLTKTLDYLTGRKPKSAKPSTDDVKTLVDRLHQPGTLLVLDGFERELRAFSGLNAAYQGDDAKVKENDRDCVSPLAEIFLRKVATLPNIRSKVLLTTRLTPRVLETRGSGFLHGCREEELLQMQPADAVQFFRAQGIRGTHAEIEQVCEPYGYHPLSLRLLTGLIVSDSEQKGQISVTRLLDVSGDLVGRRRHHVLEVAYDNLAPGRKVLLSRIACFRSPVTFEALEALAVTAGESYETLANDLSDLVTRGLLHHDTEDKRFDLHPIVRRFAYDQLAAPDRAATHTTLRDYFAAVPELDSVTCLEDLNPVIELYHHTVRAGQFGDAYRLFHDRLSRPIYHQFGAYQLCIDLLGTLFPDGEENPPRLKHKSDQAWTLNELASSYSLSGQPYRAIPVINQAIAIAQKSDDKSNLAACLGSMANTQLKTGTLRGAEVNLRQRIDLCRGIDDGLGEAIGHRELGRLLVYRGAYAESKTELATGLRVFKRQGDMQAQGICWSWRALYDLNQLRSNHGSALHLLQSALESAERALELADEDARSSYPVELDFVRAHWLLGAAHRVSGQPDKAESHLHEALERCRRVGWAGVEADILIDLARLRIVIGAPDNARRLTEDALLITERSGYVLQGADAHLELAKLARDRGDKETALDHARQARDLATCDGPPDYTYHAAYTEAGALLDELKS